MPLRATPRKPWEGHMAKDPIYVVLSIILDTCKLDTTTHNLDKEIEVTEVKKLA